MQLLMSLWTTLVLFTAVLADGWLGVYFTEAKAPTIAEVIPGSPADKAGLKPGDVFVAVGDQAVTTRDAFVAAIRAQEAGKRLQLKVQRGNGEVTVVVKLGERPDESQIPPPRAQGDNDVPPEHGEPKAKGSSGKPAPTAEPGNPDGGDDRHGMKALLNKVQPDRNKGGGQGERAFLGVGLTDGEHGVTIDRVVGGSPAAAAGIAVGDVLTKWGDVAVHDTGDVETAIHGAKPGAKVALLLQSGGGTKSAVVTLGTAPASADKEEDEEGEEAEEHEAAKPAKAAKPEKAAKPAKPQPKPKLEARGGGKELAFGDDFAAAMTEAKAGHKPLLAVFGADWNSSCQAQRRAFGDASVQQALAACVRVWVDTDNHGELAKQHKVQELPTLLLFVDGRPTERHQGYLPPEGLAELLQRSAPPAAGVSAAKPAPSPKPVKSEPKAPAPTPAATGDADLDKELRAIRAELRAIRDLLEELRKK